MKGINDFIPEELQGRDYRLWKEWKEIDDLCNRRKTIASNPGEPSIIYIIRKRNYLELPTEYEIWYRVKSIVGVEEGPIPRKPIFGNLHKMSIMLPNNYPSADGNPRFQFLTNIWHPNICHSGDKKSKGHVCLNSKEMGVLSSLSTLVVRVERYLKYHLYHAQNTYPYPEDQVVAQWVREEGEPNGWTRFKQNDEEPEQVQKPIEEAPVTICPKPIQTSEKKKFRI